MTGALPAPISEHASHPQKRAERFRYVSHDFDVRTGRLVCQYAMDSTLYEEIVTFNSPAQATNEASLQAAAHLVFLLAGISYYKTAAPPVIEVPAGLRPAERTLLDAFYREGLGEFFYRNGLDIADVRIDAPVVADLLPQDHGLGSGVLAPFGGGLDSIVTVEGLRAISSDVALFIVSREGDRYDAIENSATVTGLPIVRAERRLDDKVLRSAELGYLTGHVPVTGIISAIAVMAAILEGRHAVAMSNEWSASSGNLVWNGVTVNHQWSKSLHFEDLFRNALDSSVPATPEYFSWLRPRSELWVARQFTDLRRYHRAFRSCNRAFFIDRDQRLDRWCGRCDKCCFINLILSPFMSPVDLGAIFGGLEPLQQTDLLDQFRSLLGLGAGFKPFECVGDINESRVAIVAAAARQDRADTPILKALAKEVLQTSETDFVRFDDLLRPVENHHHIPARYALPDLLV